MGTRRAAQLSSALPSISSRDAIHFATMQHHGIQRIFSFDRGFDACPAITRLPA
ncbi:MAG: type II toxin-antitoxin system VapC family toxin [Terriglobales bacterium]